MQTQDENTTELKTASIDPLRKTKTQPEEVSDLRKTMDDAREVLRGGDRPSDDLKALYKKLEALDQFAYASEVLSKKINTDKKEGNPVSLKEYQTLAKFIYKDESLPSSFKFDRALHELNGNDELEKTKKCETLGLTGAIYKNKWLYDHQVKNLILSQFYYKRGFALWKEYVAYARELERAAIASGNSLWHEPVAISRPGDNDDGYTAINYAYICELIAVDRLEEIGKITSVDEFIQQQFEDAKNTRIFLLEFFLTDYDKPTRKLKVHKPENWVYASIAEAYFGLHYYEAALEYINLYSCRSDVQEWEKRTFSKQLFSIAYLQTYQENFIKKPGKNGDHRNGNKEENEKWKFLKEEAKSIHQDKINNCLVASNYYRLQKTGYPHSTVEVKKDGKLGLALSGGGFRASLFHIGVLAGLAEKDELRNVEVISCVSGGSIIGAFYYLKLKELLETKPDLGDGKIEKEDYIRIVKETETEFLAGVQKNLRMRVFTNIVCNFKMLFRKNYSRTHRMGELYEAHLFKGLLKRKNEEGFWETVTGAVYMKDLFINPKDDPAFSIKKDNWRRRNKVPQLVLNATSVNTGHNWQFTASWMGEPPGNIQADIDVKPRLRRMYYDEAPEEFRNIRLGYAVGASSCVPVMFEPMPMFGLYEHIDLQLIDGGLHDNQGIAALIEQECRNMIISDASGQLPTTKLAETNNAGLFFRADNILQERLRELQFMDIKERNYTAQLNKLLVVTLKNDLPSDPENWKYCKDPKRKILYSEIKDVDKDLTKYSIQRNVQTQLSEIRTDLDSFNDTESYALMYSGYAQVKYEYIKQKWNEQVTNNHADAITNQDTEDYQFLGVKQFVTIPEKAAEIEHLLKTASKLPFKVVDVNKPLKYGLTVLGFLALGYFIYLGYQFFFSSITFNLPVQVIIFSVVIFFIGFFSKMLSSLLDYKTTIRRYLIFSITIIVGWILSNLYILFLNDLYNKAGKIKPGSSKNNE